VLYYALKVALSAMILVAVSAIAKRNSGAAALLAALPLTSILAFIWLHVEGTSSVAIGELSGQIFWLVLPSLVLFLLLPALLRYGLGFWLSLTLAALATVASYYVLLPVLRRMGVQL
jgi:hypothetical protein